MDIAGREDCRVPETNGYRPLHTPRSLWRSSCIPQPPMSRAKPAHARRPRRKEGKREGYLILGDIFLGRAAMAVIHRKRGIYREWVFSDEVESTNSCVCCHFRCLYYPAIHRKRDDYNEWVPKWRIICLR